MDDCGGEALIQHYIDFPPVDLKLPASDPKSRSDFHPPFGPSTQTLDHWLQTGASFCQLVAYPHRRPRNDRAPDEPLRFELTQPLGEQSVGEPRHRRQQFVKTLRPAQHHADDRAAPTPTDQFHGMVKTRTDFRFFIAAMPRRGGRRPFSRAFYSTRFFFHV